MYGGTPEENKECALEDIALQVGRIDNLLAAMSLPIDNSIHVEKHLNDDEKNNPL